MKYKDRDALVEDLREFADFIEKNGHKLPITHMYHPVMRLSQRFYADQEDEQSLREVREQMVRAARNIGGVVEKNYRMGDLELNKTTKNGLITLTFETSQENVCTKRVVATKQIPKKIYVEVPGEFIDEEIVEWDCHPLLK